MMKHPLLVISLLVGSAAASLACGSEPDPDRPHPDGTAGGGNVDPVAYRASLCKQICAKDATLDAGTQNPDGGGCGYEATCEAFLCSTEGFSDECQATMTPLFECLIEADPSLFYCNGTYGVGVDIAAAYDCPALATPWLTCLGNTP